MATRTRPPKPPTPPALRPPADTIHITIIANDPRLYNYIRENVYVIGPPDRTTPITAHVVWNDPEHPAANVPALLRAAAVSLGLTDAEQVGFQPVSVELGWTPPRKDT